MWILDISSDGSGRDAMTSKRDCAEAKKKGRKELFGTFLPVRRFNFYQKNVVPTANASSLIFIPIWFSAVVWMYSACNFTQSVRL